MRTPGNVERLLTFEGDVSSKTFLCECLSAIVYAFQSYVYGLNFTSVEEARNFKTALDRCYEQQLKHKRRGSVNASDDGYTATPAPSSSGYGGSSGMSQARSRPSNAQISSNNVIIPTSNPVGGDLASQKKSAANARRPKGSKDTRKKKLTKSDIGLPTNFEHRVHVGWDPSKGLQSNQASSGDDLDPTIKQLLDKIGLQPMNVKKEDRKFIYEFVEQHGGLDQLKREMSQQQQPPPVPPPPPSRRK